MEALLRCCKICRSECKACIIIQKYKEEKKVGKEGQKSPEGRNMKSKTIFFNPILKGPKRNAQNPGCLFSIASGFTQDLSY